MTELVQLHEHVVPGKRLGRHIEHDPLSRNHPFETARPLPIRSILWPRSGDPFDQGDIGSCTGEATAGAVNTSPLVHPGRLLAQPDALAIYELATKLDKYPGEYPPTDTGSSGLAAAKAARKMGLIGSYKHAFTLGAALQALMHGPVITGVPWYEGFDSPDPTGLVAVTGQVRGGHEFVIRGLELGHDLKTYQDAILDADNSWGLGWGIQGRFRFTVASWQRLLSEQGDATILLP